MFILGWILVLLLTLQSMLLVMESYIVFGNNLEDGSYGPTLITEHFLSLPEQVGSQILGQKRKVWALHGHLSLDSITGITVGSQIKAGDKIAKGGE